MRGIFAVVKPVGLTSAAVTNRIKAVLRNRAGIQIKVGHGGTLDKSARGVLVIGLGKDCKQLTKALDENKYYECVGELGIATDSYDAEGEVVQRAPWHHVRRSDLEGVLTAHFTGEITQSPPTYSALKWKGTRLSDLARRGVYITPKPRQVIIHSISLLDFQPPLFTISVTCSSGTYIRSIVHDIGQHLGSVAHVKALCRTRQGDFTLEHALEEKEWTYENIQDAIEGTCDHLIH